MTSIRRLPPQTAQTARAHPQPDMLSLLDIGKRWPGLDRKLSIYESIRPRPQHRSTWPCISVRQACAQDAGLRALQAGWCVDEGEGA